MVCCETARYLFATPSVLTISLCYSGRSPWYVCLHARLALWSVISSLSLSLLCFSLSLSPGVPLSLGVLSNTPQNISTLYPTSSSHRDLLLHGSLPSSILLGTLVAHRSLRKRQRYTKTSTTQRLSSLAILLWSLQKLMQLTCLRTAKASAAQSTAASSSSSTTQSWQASLFFWTRQYLAAMLIAMPHWLGMTVVDRGRKKQKSVSTRILQSTGLGLFLSGFLWETIQDYYSSRSSTTPSSNYLSTSTTSTRSTSTTTSSSTSTTTQLQQLFIWSGIYFWNIPHLVNRKHEKASLVYQYGRVVTATISVGVGVYCSII